MNFRSTRKNALLAGEKMKEYDYAIEYAKVFINLTTVLLGLTVTFISQIIGNNPHAKELTITMLVSWVFWIFSIFMGARSIADIVTLVAGSDDSPTSEDESPTSEDESPTSEDEPPTSEDEPPTSEDESSRNDDGGVFDQELNFKLQLQLVTFILGFLVLIGTAFYAAFTR
jgi:Na+/melibiose symporter-like transporter